MDDERDLIARAQRGDAQAYESLVRQHEQLAFRAAYLITHDAAEAADAAQDAFLRAYRALNSFKLGQPFRPWLLRIVTNQALNRVKAAQRRTRMSERYAHELEMNPRDPSPDQTLAEKEAHARLLDAVTRLSADEQALVSLRYFLELPESEVAETLGVPLGTIKSRLHRTLARLREIIQREFPDLEPVISEQ
ncbi:MAG: sigma-70 family RNA polymerase sigma factor [Chloroflexi bacterium]|nr:sigma-70 family RNA polymerase sigma factor [Chloroflexota bacterium]